MPKAVLLDVGGVLLLPSHDHMAGALGRAGHTGAVELLDRAHYHGAARLHQHLDTTEWPDFWDDYLEAYVTTCEVPDALRADALEHLRNEFTVIASWSRVAPGAHEGLQALVATGVRLGVVSNADGTVEQQLIDSGVAQVGPGPFVELECVVDSTVVGVAKPDPAIFRIALDAMDLAPEDVWYVGDTPAFDVRGARNAGIEALLIDPHQLHVDAGYERVASLLEVAERIEHTGDR